MLERIHLAIVQEVDRHGSLTAAANVLCLTQSALSHSIASWSSSSAPPSGCAKGAACA
jgi:hypothetical protein